MITSIVSRLFSDKEPTPRPYLIILLVTVGIIVSVGTGVYLLWGENFAVLQPKGTISREQAELIWFATALSMIVIVPVYIMTIAFAMRYRKHSSRGRYQPELSHSRIAEIIWWGIPILIILVLSIITWRTSFALDPYKPLQSDERPVTVQVVALEWKWLFIYPESGIASVNYLMLPEDRPVNFRITADAPMNTLWIPELGGMVYAMKGMETQLHLMAEEQGSFMGRSANLSGEGFSDMTFVTDVRDEQTYGDWQQAVKQKANRLDDSAYDTLVKPGVIESPMTYGDVSSVLYGDIIDRYDHYHGHDAKKQTDKNHGDH